MNYKFKLSERIFVLLYFLFALALSVILIFFLPECDYLLTILIIPLMYTGVFFPRRFYLTAMAIGVGNSFLVIYYIAPNFIGSTETVLSTWLVIFAISEFVRFLFARQRKLEEALRESEEKYKSLFNNIPIPAFCSDLQTGELRHCNEALARFIGFQSPEEVIRRQVRLADYYGWDKRAELIKRLMTGEKNTNMEVSYVNDGKLFQLLGSVSVSNDRKHYEGCFLDVSENKRIFNSLKESEERFRALVETTNDWVWEVNQNLEYTYVSPKVRDLLGYEPADILGKTPFYCMPMEEIKLIEERLTSIIENRQPLIGFENIYLHKDGRAVVIETSGVPFFDAQGNFCGYRGIDRDITHRKQIENALRESESKLRAIVENSTNLFYSHTPDHVLTYVSPRSREFFQCEPEEALIKWTNFLTDNPLNEKGFELAQRAIETGLPQPPYLLELVGKQGRKFWVEVHETPVVRDGETVGIVGALIDITDRIQAEEERRKFEAQIQQSQKLESLGILAGGIAHDFNNLLVGILGNADLGLRRIDSGQSCRNYFEEIILAGRRAAELINQMLAYAGKGHFTVESVNLNELIEEMAQLLQVSISKKMRILRDFTHPLPAIQADVAQIRQVVMNLISNAADAIGDNEGVIQLKTGVLDAQCIDPTEMVMNHDLEAGTYVFLEVADTGCGMDGETCRKIFDPFFTTKFTGRGLGLAAVLGIVRGHHGVIKVNSEMGKGSVFTVLIPSSNHKISENVKIENLTTETWQGSGMVLVVDDEETVRVITQTILEDMGFSVCLACDGREGVEIFRQYQSDIVFVLLDMTMPCMSGEEAFREIRAIRNNIPIILTSGYTVEEVAKSFSDKGTYEFLQKPFQMNTLIQSIRRVLNP